MDCQAWLQTVTVNGKDILWTAQGWNLGPRASSFKSHCQKLVIMTKSNGEGKSSFWVVPCPSCSHLCHGQSWEAPDPLPAACEPTTRVASRVLLSWAGAVEPQTRVMPCARVLSWGTVLGTIPRFNLLVLMQLCCVTFQPPTVPPQLLELQKQASSFLFPA